MNQAKPISDELLSILVCPETKQEISLAPDSLISQLNQKIAQGQAKKTSGQPVSSPITAGLVRTDNKIIYPIVEGIPVMLVEEGILLEN